MLAILLDENIDGYADYLSRCVFSPAWSDIASLLGVRIVKFDEVGLVKGTPDAQIWEFCQQQHLYLLTDNRNQDKDDSLETVIRTRLAGACPHGITSSPATPWRPSLPHERTRSRALRGSNSGR